MTTVALKPIRDALARAGLVVSERGVLPQTVEGITDDSRAVTTSSLFLAVRGSERDGHEFLPAAERLGAAVAVVDDPARTSLPALVVRDTRRAAAVAAAAFYGEPASALRLVGVTGTNGKTTTVSLIRHLLDEPSSRSASIGTLGVLIGSEGESLDGASGLTTPGPVELQRVLRALVDKGVRTVAMETSSHALHQRRVEGLRFEVAVFTNLTRDHLDYHGTMEAYFEAKARLVALLTESGTAVINADDPAFDALPTAPRAIRFGLGRSPFAVRRSLFVTNGSPLAVSADDVAFTSAGSTWQLLMGESRHAVLLPLIGDFNISNALAAAGAAYALRVRQDDIARRLATTPQVPGRLEIIAEQPTVLRDYAHTPDALERALGAVRPFTEGALAVVFGCGGDRDRGKRPEMGRIAESLADRVFVTSDNPRTENPERILDDIESGMKLARHQRIEDRRQAIAAAIHSARAGDVILLAGKGHETYQIRGTVQHPFDERVIVQEIIPERAN